MNVNAEERLDFVARKDLLFLAAEHGKDSHCDGPTGAGDKAIRAKLPGVEHLENVARQLAPSSSYFFPRDNRGTHFFFCKAAIPTAYCFCFYAETCIQLRLAHRDFRHEVPQRRPETSNGAFGFRGAAARNGLSRALRRPNPRGRNEAHTKTRLFKSKITRMRRATGQ